MSGLAGISLSSHTSSFASLLASTQHRRDSAFPFRASHHRKLAAVWLCSQWFRHTDYDELEWRLCRLPLGFKVSEADWSCLLQNLFATFLVAVLLPFCSGHGRSFLHLTDIFPSPTQSSRGPSTLRLDWSFWLINNMISLFTAIPSSASPCSSSCAYWVTYSSSIPSPSSSLVSLLYCWFSLLSPRSSHHFHMFLCSVLVSEFLYPGLSPCVCFLFLLLPARILSFILSPSFSFFPASISWRQWHSASSSPLSSLLFSSIFSHDNRELKHERRMKQGRICLLYQRNQGDATTHSNGDRKQKPILYCRSHGEKRWMEETWWQKKRTGEQRK